MDQLNLDNLQAIQISSSQGAGYTSAGTVAQARMIRRLTQWSGSDHTNAGGVVLTFWQGVGTDGAGLPASINSERLATGVVLSLQASSCSLSWQ